MLYRFEDNAKYGYRDENDALVISAKYEDGSDFKKGLAIVKYNGFYGVINSSDDTIIDFIYSSIEENKLFFECKTINEHAPKEKTFWYNRDGVLLHEGKAKALSENFLCISNGKKFGVIRQDGNRIINYLYDEIVQKNELLFVLRGDNIGLYDLNGNIILDVFCKAIESVVIDNNPMILGLVTEENRKRNHYLGYNKEYFFDANIRMNAPHGENYYDYGSNYFEKYVDRLYREKLKAKNNNIMSQIFENDEWDINKPIIISSDNSKMLFLKSEGILPDSEYDDIQPITQICYIVKKDNLFGVYRIDTRALIVPIEYDNIRFYGGHTVLVCKDNLWGARYLSIDSNIFYKIINRVSIPTEYFEIKILDDYQHFFGCMKKWSYSSEPYYAIVRASGEEIEEIIELECDSQFVYIDSSHFMTSIGGKFGCINLQGQKVIPFKYDEFKLREDGHYNVRINNRWGILSIDGREITKIKYSSPLPSPLEKAVIVNDAESECFGLVDSNGVELIPTIYEHLLGSEDERFYYFGYGGHEDEYWSDFFAGNISNAKWGVINIQGEQLMDAKYDCFKIKNGFILAGRDGSFLCDYYDPSEDYHNCPYYDGVYDLYSKEGELLIGGFREFEYDETNEVYIFFFGGEWKKGPAFDDWWNNQFCGDCKVYWFEKGVDLWLILDKDFKTILRDKDGNSKQFDKGFLGEIDIKQEENKIKHVYNMPIELMAKGFSHVAINSVIINNSNSEYHKSQAVDIETGRMTKLYSKIEQITESLFFFADDDKVGITNIESEHIIKDCLFITNPVAGYMFIPKEKTEGVYDVILYSIDRLKKPVATAITDISQEDLIYLVDGHWLKMDYNENSSGLKALVIPRNSFLTKDFIDLVTLKEGTDYKPFSHNSEDSYFFSNDYHFLPDEPNYDNDRDDRDYMRDSWDAMTDGMYGDMPDGFSGDFDFTGR